MAPSFGEVATELSSSSTGRAPEPPLISDLGEGVDCGSGGRRVFGAGTGQGRVRGRCARPVLGAGGGAQKS